jgi:hypothetical protein
MYGEKFWKRVGIKQICEFIRSGSEGGYEETGTAEERSARYVTALGECLRAYRDNVLGFDWDSVKDNEQLKNMTTENMWNDILDVISDTDELAYEVGFIAGIKIGQEMANIAQTKGKFPVV